jgi:hypothetical protein
VKFSWYRGTQSPQVDLVSRPGSQLVWSGARKGFMFLAFAEEEYSWRFAQSHSRLPCLVGQPTVPSRNSLGCMAPLCLFRTKLTFWERFCSGWGATQEAEGEQWGNLKGFADVGGNFMRHISSVLKCDNDWLSGRAAGSHAQGLGFKSAAMWFHFYYSITLLQKNCELFKIQNYPRWIVGIVIFG